MGNNENTGVCPEQGGGCNISVGEWRAVIDVHLNGSFYVSRAAAPYFETQESGAYIHMVSTSGLIGNVGQANYSAAKLGMVALSKSIAMDMARFRSSVNVMAEIQTGLLTLA